MPHATAPRSDDCPERGQRGGNKTQPMPEGTTAQRTAGEESNIPPPPFTVSRNLPRYLDPGLRRPLPGAPVRSSPSTAR